jgi:high affinity Mn2+ porin
MPWRDTHFSFGGDLRRDWWGQPRDKFGVAFVRDGLSGCHRRYPVLGGLSFVIDDGKLGYKPGQVIGTCNDFPLPVGPEMFATFDLQYINNPGYNCARGPVVVPGVRLHIEL